MSIVWKDRNNIEVTGELIEDFYFVVFQFSGLVEITEQLVESISQTFRRFASRMNENSYEVHRQSISTERLLIRISNNHELYILHIIYTISTREGSFRSLPEDRFDEDTDCFDVDRGREDFSEIDFQPTDEIRVKLLPFIVQISHFLAFIVHGLFVESELAHRESIRSINENIFADSFFAGLGTHLFSRHLCRKVSSVFWNRVTVNKA